MDVVVNPPRPGEPSHDTFIAEKKHVLGDLATKARMTTELLNAIDGITCNEVMGAMYAFPRIHLPQKAIDEALVSSPAVGLTQDRWLSEQISAQLLMIKGSSKDIFGSARYLS